MVNDLEIRNLPICKFVEDITASESVPKNNVSLIQYEVKQIETWSESNKLQLNPSKCNELITDFKQQKQQFDPIIINNQAIEVVIMQKFCAL